jgi:hydrogenase maturation protease
MVKTLILGLGNPFRGDDGVGAAVIAALNSQELTPDVVVLGSWKRFLPGEAVLPVGDGAMQGTLHAAGLAEALALAEALEILPPELVFYGVQPENTGWSANLSDVVAAAVPVLCEAISAELSDLTHHQYQTAVVLNK